MIKQPQLSEKKVGKDNKEVIGKGTSCKPSQHAKSSNFFLFFFRFPGSPIQFKCRFIVNEFTTWYPFH